jgi:hypothetical protein
MIFENLRPYSITSKKKLQVTIPFHHNKYLMTNISFGFFLLLIALQCLQIPLLLISVAYVLQLSSLREFVSPILPLHKSDFLMIHFLNFIFWLLLLYKNKNDTSMLICCLVVLLTSLNSNNSWIFFTFEKNDNCIQLFFILTLIIIFRFCTV